MAPNMNNNQSTNQIAFRYRSSDSPNGITRETAKRIAERLGVDETQAIHQALHDLAVKILPQYEPDDGALNAQQMRLIKKRAASAVVPSNAKPRSSLFATKTK